MSGKSPREPQWGVSRQGWPASARPSQPPSSLREQGRGSEEGGSEESEEASRRGLQVCNLTMRACNSIDLGKID